MDHESRCDQSTLMEVSAVTTSLNPLENDVSAYEEVETEFNGMDLPETSTPNKQAMASTSETDPKTNLCFDCGKTFKHACHLSDHQKEKHDRGQARYSCTVCDKKMVNRNQFLGHMNTHNNTKPYRCDICSKTYAYPRSFKTHKCDNYNSNSQKAFIKFVHGNRTIGNRTVSIFIVSRTPQNTRLIYYATFTAYNCNCMQ
jgi:hypothetical protein